MSNPIEDHSDTSSTSLWEEGNESGDIPTQDSMIHRSLQPSEDLPTRTLKRIRKPRAFTSWVWKNGDTVNGTSITISGKEFWKCAYCKQKYLQGQGTTHAASHLRKTHSLEEIESTAMKRLKKSHNSIEKAVQRMEEIANEKAVQKNARELEEAAKQIQLYPPITSELIRNLLVTLVVKRDLPFTFPAWQELHTLILAVRPDTAEFLPRDSQTVRSWTMRIFQHEKEKIKALVGEAKVIHISLDMWTSPNQLAIMAVLGHFVDRKGNLRNILLSLSEVEGTHTGENICNIFLNIADDYAIRAKLGYFVLDNAANNDTFIFFLQQQLALDELTFNSEERRLRCTGHIINLSVQAFLFGNSTEALECSEEGMEDAEEQLASWRKLGPLGKAHNIAVHSRHSPQRIAAFKRLSGGYLIKRDNATRWNSWADLLETLLMPDIRHAVQDYVDEFALDQDRLSHQDWILLERVHRILCSFKKATKIAEGTDATLSKVLPVIDFLLNTYKIALEESSDYPVLSNMIRIGWEKLDKYYAATSRAPVYVAAVVLNPKYKWRYFETNWKAAWVRDAKRSLKGYWERYLATKGGDTFHMADANEGNKMDDSDDELSRWLNMEAVGPVSGNSSSSRSLLNDYERYCKSPEPERSVKEPISWWLETRQQTDYPTLSSWAVAIHSIPAMSSECERVFSGAKKIITHDRYRVRGDTLEALQCLKSWNCM